MDEKKHPPIWTTHDEIDFLKEATLKRDHRQRLEFLQKYREAMNNRTRWEGLKKGEIKKYVERRIRTLAKGGGQ